MVHTDSKRMDIVSEIRDYLAQNNKKDILNYYIVKRILDFSKRNGDFTKRLILCLYYFFSEVIARSLM